MTRTGNLPAETIFVDTFNDDGFANVGDFISPQTDGKTITFAAGQTQAQFAITILDGHSHPTDPTFSLLIQRNPGDNDLTFLAKTLFTIPEGAAPNPMEVVSFGTRMMESLGQQLCGQVQLAYHPTGFVYILDVPLSSLTAKA